MDTFSVLEHRVARLESQNRSLRRINATVVIAAVVAIGAGMAADEKKGDPISDVLRAKRLEVVNPAGDVVWFAESSEEGGRTAVLSKQKEVAWQADVGEGGGGSIAVCNKSGKARWQALATEDGGGTIHFNNDQKPVMLTGVTETGGLFAITNPNSKLACRLRVRTEKNAGGSLELFNGDEHPVVNLSCLESGGLLELDNDKQTGGFAALAKDDGGQMGITDGNGKPGVVAASHKHGGFLRVMGSNEKSSASLSCNEEGGLMRLFNKEEKETCRIEAHPDTEGGVMALFSKDGHRVVDLFTQSGDHGALVLRNALNDKSFVATASYEGGAFSVFNRGGEKVLMKGESNGVGGLFEIGNNDNNAVVRIGTDGLSNGTVNIHDKAGLEIGRLGCKDNRGSFLYLRDEKGVDYIQLWNDNGRGQVYSRGN